MNKNPVPSPLMQGLTARSEVDDRVIFDIATGLFWREQTDAYDAVDPASASALTITQACDQLIGNLAIDMATTFYTNGEYGITGYIGPCLAHWAQTVGIRERSYRFLATRLDDIGAGVFHLVSSDPDAAAFDVVGVKDRIEHRWLIANDPVSVLWFVLRDLSEAEVNMLRLLTDAVVSVEDFRAKKSMLQNRVRHWNAHLGVGLPESER